jgi:tetratricopeptide (TPR) repeat protein
LKRITKTFFPGQIFFVILVLLAAGCSLEKKSGFNRAMQNLTAHYNIVFDANELLRQKQESYAVSFVDAYNEILSVYQDTTEQSSTPDKDLEEAKAKGGKIINIKEQSGYIGEAYMIMGKADYLEGNYFSANEYFNYVIRSFPKQPKLTEEAQVWKTRTLIRLNLLPQAKLSADSAINNIVKKTPKSTIASVYASKLQYDIDAQEYEDAEKMAQQAIKYSGDKNERLRWTFIMAQLQELNKKPGEAYKNYTSIVNSNAAFEMAFNANLNRIRIEQNQNGAKVNRIDRLTALIKNENNKDFIDQIYYQIGQLKYADKDIIGAIKNYQASVRYSKKNQSQKGLSYLRLADIFFKDRADYVTSKKYYDSTLLALPPSYPGYQLIKKKSDNLQLLADRFGVITREELLQSLAKMDEKARDAKVDSLVNAEILKRQTQAIVDAGNATSTSSLGPRLGAASSFYFYNSNALSQGYNDFKRRWGNRKLEDNWRRSTRASSDITAANSQNVDPDAPAADQANNKCVPTAGDYRKQLVQNLPLTPDLLAKSNARIYNAYFDVANFYRDVLGDRKEAIDVYLLLLTRFPDSPDKPALYYNLYRLYSDDNNTAKAEEYKNLILKNYPETAFAKIIIDPNYSQKLNDADAELTGLYNKVYDAYSNKDYPTTVTLVDDVQKQKPDNKWSAQLAYLRAIAKGHEEKFDPFRADLVQITNKYPNDKLITPLVKQHITYIDANKDALMKREFVLADKDPNEVPFVPPMSDEEIAAIKYNNLVAERQAAAVKQAQAYKDSVAKAEAKKLATNNQPNNVQGKTPAVTNPVASNPGQPARVVPSIFSMKDSTNYYFVVNVSTATINLASSRFGIGQFNRANFPNGAITHQLIPLGDSNQLIYIGRFYSLSAVKDYARAIIPLMPDIMKVPKDQYSFFIITKENLDKVTSKPLLDNYLEYYQNNY